MKVELFLDTNILIYAISSAPSEQEKTKVARELLKLEGLGTSAQVLQEFYVISTGKLARNLSHAVALSVLEWLTSLLMVSTDTDLFWDAVKIKDRYKISYWDAAILAAARRLGAKALYSEDLNHGQIYDGIKVVNPFN